MTKPTEEQSSKQDDRGLTWEFRGESWRSARDAGRLRHYVYVQDASDPETRRGLGDVWRVKSTGRWYFTHGGGNLRKMGDRNGYDTKLTAAVAMLEHILAEGDVRVRHHLKSLNTYRQAGGLPRLELTEARP